MTNEQRYLVRDPKAPVSSFGRESIPEKDIDPYSPSSTPIDKEGLRIKNSCHECVDKINTTKGNLKTKYQ